MNSEAIYHVDVHKRSSPPQVQLGEDVQVYFPVEPSGYVGHVLLWLPGGAIHVIIYKYAVGSGAAIYPIKALLAPNERRKRTAVCTSSTSEAENAETSPRRAS